MQLEIFKLLIVIALILFLKFLVTIKLLCCRTPAASSTEEAPAEEKKASSPTEEKKTSAPAEAAEGPSKVNPLFFVYISRWIQL